MHRFQPHDPKRQKEIDNLRRRAKRMAGNLGDWVNPNTPQEVQRDFWKRVLAFESAPRESLFQKLAVQSISLPPPESLPPGPARRKAKEVQRALARLGVFVSGTDKITPQELYFDFWHNLLRDEYEPLPPASGEWRIELLPERDDLGERQYIKYFLKPIEGSAEMEGCYHVTFKL